MSLTQPTQPRHPLHLLPALRAAALHDAVTSRRIEARALAAAAPGTLMRRAGLAVTRLAIAVSPHARRIWVAVGPGGNGGDGLHAAAELAGIGREVRVSLLADADRLSADAAEGLRRAREAGVAIGPDLPGHDTSFDLAIDALLGLGATRAPLGALRDAIARLDGQVPCLAVDLPSGLSPDTGALLGDLAVQARWTLSLLTAKPGLFTGAGRARSGEVWLDTLGVEPQADEAPVARLTASDTAAPWLWPRRSHDSHKGRFGDVHVVGGAPGMAGAARLAAHAAQAAGAGRTFVGLLDRAATTGDLTRPEWLWHADPARVSDRVWAEATVVAGCGGGQAIEALLPRLLSHAAALVLDADALNAVARDSGLAEALRARATRGQATVITPHPLEAARLLGCKTSDVQQDRLTAATRLASQLSCTAVLKGSGTVIATPGACPLINSTGNAALASGGSGDVLAGWIGGLWAAWQDSAAPVARPSAARAYDVAAAAAWLHGQAADEDPAAALRALDLVQTMRRIAAPAA